MTAIVVWHRFDVNVSISGTYRLRFHIWYRSVCLCRIDIVSTYHFGWGKNDLLFPTNEDAHFLPVECGRALAGTRSWTRPWIQRTRSSSTGSRTTTTRCWARSSLWGSAWLSASWRGPRTPAPWAGLYCPRPYTASSPGPGRRSSPHCPRAGSCTSWRDASPIIDRIRNYNKLGPYRDFWTFALLRVCNSVRPLSRSIEPTERQ